MAQLSAVGMYFLDLGKALLFGKVDAPVDVSSMAHIILNVSVILLYYLLSFLRYKHSEKLGL